MTTLQTDYPQERLALEARRYDKDPNNILRLVENDTDEVIHWRLPGGGFQSNILDLALFANSLVSQSLLGSDAQTRMTTERLESDGDQTGYAQGHYVTSDGSGMVLRLGHGGVQKGVRTHMYYYPTRDAAVVFMSNSTHTDRDRIQNRLINALESWTWGVNDYSLTGPLSCGEETQTESDSRFAAIWRDGPTGQLLRRGYALGKFADERERLRTQGYELTDLETFEQDGERLWDGVFTPGIAQTRLWRNFELEPFLQKVQDQGGEGYRLVDVEVYTGSQGQHLFAGVFAQENERHALEIGLNTAEFNDIWEQRAADGYRLLDIETYEATNGMRLWAGVFVEGTGGYGLFRNVPPEDFAARRNDFLRDGLRLVDVETYFGSQGQPLWALVARPFAGNVESRTDKTFCGTWNGPFTGFWETHEDQMRQGRSLIDFERYPAPPD